MSHPDDEDDVGVPLENDTPIARSESELAWVSLIRHYIVTRPIGFGGVGFTPSLDPLDVGEWQLVLLLPRLRSIFDP